MPSQGRKFDFGGSPLPLGPNKDPAAQVQQFLGFLYVIPSEQTSDCVSVLSMQTNLCLRKKSRYMRAHINYPCSLKMAELKNVPYPLASVCEVAKNKSHPAFHAK